MRMIDLHCHLLPGIDDGARTMEQALSMARFAADDGIGYCVLTPHIHPGRYQNSRVVIKQEANRFRQVLKREGIQMDVGYAAEVRLCPELGDLLDRDQVPFYGELDGYRIMLLEFPHSNVPKFGLDMVRNLIRRKIRPMIAHPERNKDVIDDISVLLPFVELGCMLQLTASAVAGRFGKAPHRSARKILKLDAFKVLATDSHNLQGRLPQLKEGRDAAAKIIGEQAADDLVFANPLKIIWSQIIDEVAQCDTEAMSDRPSDALDDAAFHTMP